MQCSFHYSFVTNSIKVVENIVRDCFFGGTIRSAHFRCVSCCIEFLKSTKTMKLEISTFWVLLCDYILAFLTIPVFFSTTKNLLKKIKKYKKKNLLFKNQTYNLEFFLKKRKEKNHNFERLRAQPSTLGVWSLISTPISYRSWLNFSLGENLRSKTDTKSMSKARVMRKRMDRSNAQQISRFI